MQPFADREEPVDPSSLDGRIAFVTAAFLLAFGFVALLDRVGAPEAFVSVVGPIFTVAALTLLGFLLHSMRVSLYYAAGRAVPAAYAGFAGAGLVVALGLPFAAEFAGRGWLSGVAGGFFLGMCAIGLFFGPLLRKSGVFSFSGLLAARFPGLPARIGLLVAAGAASVFAALAGQQAAVDALVGLTGGGRGLAAFAVAVAALLIAGPGGLLGVVWSAAAAAGVALVGWGWPAAALAVRGQWPGQGAGWSAAGKIAQAFGAAAPSFGGFVDYCVALAIALGLATLAPALAPAVATRDMRAARRAGWAGLFWTLVLAGMAAALVGAATLAVSRLAVGVPPARLPETVLSASARGDLSICGAFPVSGAQARIACASRGGGGSAPLRPGDIKATGAALLAGLPRLAELGAAANGLVASAAIALALALAAAGLQACATALSHEALYRMRGEMDLTSRRLASTRFALVAVAALGAAASAADLFEARALAALALGVSAAGVAPVAALAFWPRARDRDAGVAAYAGLFGMALALTAAGGGSVTALTLASLVGAIIGLGGGVISALAAPAQPGESRAFLLRLLRGDGQIARPDKGA